jgi:chromosome segregation ATPase
MTNGQATQIGERVAVVEEILKRVEASVAEHKANMGALGEKLDRLLLGQNEGHSERATIRAEIAAMKPHVETIKEAKLILKVSRWTVAALASMTAFLLAANGWLIVNFNWLLGR